MSRFFLLAALLVLEQDATCHVRWRWLRPGEVYDTTRPAVPCVRPVSPRVLNLTEGGLTTSGNLRIGPMDW